jgi:hypothetical protein
MHLLKVRIVLLLTVAAALNAEDISWLGTPLVGNWSTAANWSCPACGASVFPDNGVFGFDVLISSGLGADAVTLDASRTVNSLTLGAAATLTMSAGNNLTLSPPDVFNPAQLVNAGIIQVNNSTLTLNTLTPFLGTLPLNSNTGSIVLNGAASKLLFDNGGFLSQAVNIPFTGGGNLSLAGGTIAGAHGTELLSTNNNINGFGTISNLRLSLSGNTTAAGGNLTIATPAISGGVQQDVLQNFGTMTAASGDLIFTPGSGAGTLTNFGTIQTGGGNLQIQTQGASFVNQGAITVGDGRTLTLTGGGSLVNNASVSLSSAGQPTSMLLSGAGATFFLDGAGTTTLSNAGIAGVTGSESAINQAHSTIQGTGTISHLASFENRGTLRADGGMLTIGADAGSFTNSGSVVVAPGATLNVLAPFTNGTVTGSYDIGGTMKVSAPIGGFEFNSTLTLRGAVSIVDQNGSNALANVSSLPGQLVLDQASLTMSHDIGDGFSRVSLDHGSNLTFSGSVITNMQLTLAGDSTMTVGGDLRVSKVVLSGGSTVTANGPLLAIDQPNIQTSGGGNIFRAGGFVVNNSLNLIRGTTFNIGAGDMVDFRTASGISPESFLFQGVYLMEFGADVIAGTLRFDANPQPGGSDFQGLFNLSSATPVFTLRGDGQMLYGLGAGTDALHHLQQVDVQLVLDSLTSPRTFDPVSGTFRIGQSLDAELDVLGGTSLTIDGDLTSYGLTGGTHAAIQHILGGSTLTVTGTFLNDGVTVIDSTSRLNTGRYVQDSNSTQVDGALRGWIVLQGGTLKGTGVLEGELDQTGGTFSPGDSRARCRSPVTTFNRAARFISSSAHLLSITSGFPATLISTGPYNSCCRDTSRIWAIASTSSTSVSSERAPDCFSRGAIWATVSSSTSYGACTISRFRWAIACSRFRRLLTRRSRRRG